MIFYLLLCNVLFIPLIYSSNTTVSNPEIANKTLSETRKVNPSNETKVTLISEGGSLLPETSVVALSKEKLTNLDYEMSKNKVKPVVPRKGVVYKEEDSVKLPQKDSLTSKDNITVAPELPENTDILLKHLANLTDKSLHSKVNSLPIKPSSGVQNVNITKLPKKPEVLSYDTLVKSTTKSTPETFVTHQISNKALKAYVKTANSHPGMIMPLVISILLVPMFAVLGYMALRRGQEAWKNRHYKRMDFLLDGMYND